MTVDTTHASTDPTLARLLANIERVILGKPEAVRLVTIGLLAEGHVLLEDVPGTGKTTLARALARSLDLEFRRIQFTSDLLPADVVGVSLPEGGVSGASNGHAFRFQPGPIFANVVLADELNRTPPRTQSALLESMNERRVSIDGESHPLPRPFLVLATQNPLEFEGTYPLPESQLDRFLLAVRLGYPARDHEREMLRARAQGRPLEELLPVLSAAEVLDAIERTRAVRVDDAILEYVLSIIDATREGGDFLLGASPRAALGLYRAAQASALLAGRDYVLPDDVKRLALPVLAHRLVAAEDSAADETGFNAGAGGAAAARLAEQLERIPVPD